MIEVLDGPAPKRHANIITIVNYSFITSTKVYHLLVSAHSSLSLSSIFTFETLIKWSQDKAKHKVLSSSLIQFPSEQVQRDFNYCKALFCFFIERCLLKRKLWFPIDVLHTSQLAPFPQLLCNNDKKVQGGRE